MKKTYTLIALFIFQIALVFGQNSYVLNYELKKNPEIHTVTEQEAKEPYVFIKHYVACEIFYLEGGDAIEYYMEHIIKHINKKEAIDDNNKVYLPGSGADPTKYTIIEKARVIKKNGNIIDLKTKDILEEKNEEKGTVYRFFALEGIEEGDEIEYLYVYPRSPRTTGMVYSMQTSIYKREATLAIITPTNLINKYKSYNGFPEMLQDSSYDDRNFYMATANNLAGLKSEKFSAYDANRGKVAYYLYKNNYNKTTTDYYSQLTKYIVQGINEINIKKSGISKLIKSMKIDDNWSEEKKVKHIDNYLKKEFRFIEEGITGLSDINSVVKKRIGNQVGLMLLYSGILKTLNIEFEVVYTTDRTKLAFDKDFQCSPFVEEPLIYITKSKKYISPHSFTSRFGFPPEELTGNYGYFTRFINVAGIESGLGKIKYIEPVSADKSVDEFTVTLKLDKLPGCTAHLIKKETGYNALANQIFFDYVDAKTKKELEDALVKFIDEEMKIDDILVTNTRAIDFDEKPLEVVAEFSSEIFVQKAGENYLINVGKMIGPQSQLYQEEERKLPVANGFNRTYKRTLIIEIPDGYEVSNLEQLKKSILFDKDGAKDMGFVSDYTLTGNKLTIIANEYYYTLDYPKEEYSNFEKVINAAADFNKLAVILKKK